VFINTRVDCDHHHLTKDVIDLVDAFERGYINGQGAFGGGIPRPSITSHGETKAAQGTSVQPGPPQPANPTGNTFNVHNYDTGNFNVGGQVGSQQLWSQQNVGPILAVADALEEFADSGVCTSGFGVMHKVDSASRYCSGR
jgi:hypothetical protein